MNELYEQNAKIVYYFLYSLCHDRDLAEDLTQETFLQAYKSPERYNGKCKLSSWLCQIAKHLYYRHIQKAKREIPFDFSGQEQGEGAGWDNGQGADRNGLQNQGSRVQEPERQVLARIELLDVLREMQKLPAQMREVMYLRITGDLTFKEIGEILDRSENWARVSFYRGKEILLKGRMQNEQRDFL